MQRAKAAILSVVLFLSLHHSGLSGTGSQFAMAGSDIPQPGDKCYPSNMRNVPPVTQAPYPPCWYKQSDGAWACFNKVNDNCPWGVAESPPGSDGNMGVCYPGNMRTVPPITQAPYPPCWYKQSDGAWACFNKVNDKCPWDGAVGPH